MISTSTHLAQLFSHKKTDFLTSKVQLHPPMSPPRYQLATTLNSVSGGSKTFNGMACVTVGSSFVVGRLSGGRVGGGWRGWLSKDSQNLPWGSWMHHAVCLVANPWNHQMLVEQHIQNIQCTCSRNYCDFFLAKKKQSWRSWTCNNFLRLPLPFGSWNHFLLLNKNIFLSHTQTVTAGLSV